MSKGRNSKGQFIKGSKAAKACGKKGLKCACKKAKSTKKKAKRSPRKAKQLNLF